MTDTDCSIFTVVDKLVNQVESDAIGFRDLIKQVILSDAFARNKTCTEASTGTANQLAARMDAKARRFP